MLQSPIQIPTRPPRAPRWPARSTTPAAGGKTSVGAARLVIWFIGIALLRANTLLAAPAPHIDRTVGDGVVQGTNGTASQRRLLPGTMTGGTSGPSGTANKQATGTSSGMLSGMLSGIVEDAVGRPVPATITVSRPGDGLARTVQADDAGVYTVPDLPPGDYDVAIERAGMRAVRRERVRVAPSATLRLDVRLEIGGVAEAVTVTAELSAQPAGAGSLSHTLDATTIVGLPLGGRSFVSLVALAAGVAVPPGSSLPRINGGRPRTNEYLFDGLSAVQPEPGQVAFFPVLDAIQDIRIISNSPSAEYGRFGGGVVSLATRSGTNQLRGTLFDFLRHESLDARNAFAPRTAGPGAARRQQFGGVLGGPVAGDRTFFFADMQAQRDAVERTVISTVPTLLQREGIFTEPLAGRVPTIVDPASSGTDGRGRTPFPGNRIPAERIDPVASRLLQRYPLPTSAGTANNFTRTGTEIHTLVQADLRVDHRAVRTGDGGFVRLSHADDAFRPVSPLPDGSGTPSGALGVQHTRASSLVSGYQHSFSGRLLHDTRVGHTRRAVARSATRLASGPAVDLGLPGIPPTAGFADTLPTFLIAGYQHLGSPPSAALDSTTSVTQLTDTWTWATDRHLLRFGADLRWQRLSVVQPPSPAGLFQFSSLFTDDPAVAGTGASLASFLLGQVQGFSLDLQRDRIRQRAHGEEYFAQDAWRVTHGLTLDAGVRYTLNLPSVEANNQAAVFDLQTEQIEYLGRDGHSRSARRLQRLNLAPRFGVAQRVGTRMAVRGGYGLVWLEQPGISTPFTTPVFPFLQTVSQRTVDNRTPAFVLAAGPSVAPVGLTSDAGLGQGVFAVDANLGSGYVQQWNVSIDREVSALLSVGVAYVGSASTRLGVPDGNLNQLTVAQLAQGESLLARVPNPYAGVIPPSSSLGEPTIPLAQLLKPFPRFTTVSLYRQNVGVARYRGVEATLAQRSWHGLSSTVSYTWSRLRDSGSAVFDASILSGPVATAPVADAHDRRREEDASAGDIPHVLVGAFTWAVPVRSGRRAGPIAALASLVSGWTVSGVVTMQSGLPLPVTQATNFNAFAGFGTQRPNLAGAPALPRDQRSAGRWFDTEAFAVAPAFTLGTSSRNPVRGPGYANGDFALWRNLPLGPSRTLQVRVEVFNVTNAVHLGAPNTVVGTPGFGSITTAGDPRVIQLAAKVSF